MAYKIITDVATEPVSLAEARLQCKLTASDPTDEDGLIEVWITAAREAAEQYTGLALAERTLEMPLDVFPGGLDPVWGRTSDPGVMGGSYSRWSEPREDTAIRLDMPPVSDVRSIKYLDVAGVSQTLGADQYTLDAYGDARRVLLNYGCSWPTTRDVANAVQIQYDCGYAVDKIPKAAKAAILLTIGHLFEHRSDVIVDSRAVAVQLPVGAQALLDTIKNWAR
jgi:uncharacterized phiE125 gp8 family phage protein